MNNLSPLLNVLQKSIRSSGKKIIRDFDEIEKLQSSVKQTKKFIEITRSNLENDITQTLNRIKPNLSIKHSDEKKEEDCWLINIIDSLKNFSRGIDSFYINISLKEKNKINTSIIYNPIKDEIFYFQNGLGGFKNDYRIRVSERKKLSESIVSIYSVTNEINENYVLEKFRTILKSKNIETRESGSLSHDLCLLVSGKIDCLIYSSKNEEKNSYINLILSESGGIKNELDLLETKFFIVSNKYIGKIIKEMIQNKYES